MTFSAISTFNGSDEQGKARWLLEHYYEHIAFNLAASQQLAVNLPDYPIQTIGDEKLWLLDHNMIHQALWHALGGGVANDLSSLDWKNEDMLQSWLEVHGESHRVVRDGLGL